MTRPAPRSIRRCGRLAVAGAVAALASPALAVPSLTWDASGTSPAAPRDGSGTWTGAATWSTGSADVPWTDGAYATIGNNTGSGAYTIALTTNVSAGSLEFEPAGAGASYTINGNGSTLAVPSGNVFDYGLPLTLRNVTLPIGDATGNNDGAIVLENGASLRLAAGSTLAATDIVGDVAPTTVYFDGGTFRALANPNTTANPLYVQVVGTSAAYVSTGGLTFDTSQVAAGITFITDALQHDPAVTAAADGGLTVVGGGTLQLGYSKEVPGFNPVETYTGTTTVAAGTTLQLDTGGEHHGRHRVARHRAVPQHPVRRRRDAVGLVHRCHRRRDRGDPGDAQRRDAHAAGGRLGPPGQRHPERRHDHRRRRGHRAVHRPGRRRAARDGQRLGDWRPPRLQHRVRRADRRGHDADGRLAPGRRRRRRPADGVGGRHRAPVGREHVHRADQRRRRGRST